MLGRVQFDVERKEGGETRVEIYCAAKPGLLLSTVSTLDTLGLDIQQCVVSCFNDFGMHASCSEVVRLAILVSSLLCVVPIHSSIDSSHTVS